MEGHYSVLDNSAFFRAHKMADTEKIFERLGAVEKTVAEHGVMIDQLGDVPEKLHNLDKKITRIFTGIAIFVFLAPFAWGILFYLITQSGK